MIALFVDEDSMDRDLVRALRRVGIDVVTVDDARRRGKSDEEQLEYAATEGRTVYTCNVRDFARLHNRWMTSGRHHAGVIVLVDQGTGLGSQIEGLLRLTAASDAATMRDRIEYLDGWIRAWSA